MQSHTTKSKEDIKEENVNSTNRYSPGYCQWDVGDKHKILSLSGEDPCGRKLKSSALMNPVKSISGLIGLGVDVKYRYYVCVRYKSKHFVSGKLAES